MAARIVTVRVFKDAIDRLADDPQDPVNETLEGLAEEIRVVALRNIRKILHRGIPADFDLEIETGKDTKGFFFRVKPQDGRISRYLTWKELREHSWLEPAIQEVIGSGGVRSPRGRGVRAFRASGTFPQGAGFSI